MKRTLLLAVSVLSACGQPELRALEEDATCEGCPIAWTVRSGAHELTLFGSAHSVGSAAVDATSRARAASTDRFLMELDTANPDTTPGTSPLLPSGQSLEPLLGADDWQRLTTLMPIFPAETLRTFTPWYATITAVGTLYPAYGFMDEELRDLATKGGAELQFLETLEEERQLAAAAFDLSSLRAVLREPTAVKAALLRQEEVWMVGDIAGLAEAIPQTQRGPLLELRTQRWLPKIERALEQHERTFVTVRAEHLVGPNGLVARLRAEGYTVERLGARPSH